MNDTPSNLSELLDKARPEFDAMNPKELVRRSITRDRAVELTNLLLAGWQTVDSLLDDEFTPARVEQRRALRDGLGIRAWVFYGADLAANEVGSDVSKEELQQLGKQVAQHDQKLMRWAMPLFGDDPAMVEKLADIARGKGRLDDADDVLRLVKIFRDHWGLAEHLIKVTEIDKKYLDTAAGEATKLIQLLTTAATNPAVDLANRAYTAWYRDYVELMEVGRFLARREPDNEARFPGVRAAHAPRPAKANSGEGSDTNADADPNADADKEPAESTPAQTDEPGE